MTWAWLAALASGPAAAPVLGQQPPAGPLTSEEGSPLQRMSFTPMMEGAEVVGAGRLAIDVWSGYSNVFEQDSSDTHYLLLDFERLLTSMALRWGVSETLELGARMTLETTWTGILDEVIVGWHNMFGLGNANRERYPAFGYRQTLRDGNGEVYLEVPRRTLGLEDVRLFGKWQAATSRDERSALSLRAELRLPGDANLAAEERPDGAVMALGRLGVGAWYLHGMLGRSFHRASPEFSPILTSGTTFVTVAAERSLGSRVSAVAQLEVQSAALHTFEHRELDSPPINMVLGLAGRFGESWSWDVSLQEDTPPDTPAVDFTAGVRVRRVW